MGPVYCKAYLPKGNVAAKSAFIKRIKKNFILYIFHKNCFTINDMKQVYRNIIFLCLFFLVMGTLWYFGNIKLYLQISTLSEHRAFICSWIAQYPVISALVYISTFFLLTVLALPVTLALITIGGFLFNWPLGSCYSLVAMLASSVCIFTASQKMFGVYLQEKYNNELKIFNALMNHYGFYYLLFIRLFPFIPFFMVNICAGLTRINSKVFLITTLIGCIPCVVICSYLGSQCASLIVNL